MLPVPRWRKYATVLAVVGLLSVIARNVVFASLPGGAASVLPDFLARWTGGRMLLEGNITRLYDPLVQHRVQADLGVAPDSLSWFVSPPFVALLYAPFATLPYLVAAAIWAALTACLLAAAVPRLAQFGPRLWSRNKVTLVVVAGASYPVLELVGGGQDSALTLLIWVLGVSLAVRGRQVLAGLVLALAAYKPQLIFLVPLVLVNQRQWRALGGFTLGVTFLACISWTLVGVEGLRSWLAVLASPLYAEQVHVGQAWKMVSLPALTMGLSAPAGENVATVLGYSVSLVFVACFAVWLRRRREPLVAWTAAMAVTVAASPHVAVYDAVLFLPVAILLLDRRPSRSPRPLVAAFLLLTLAAPLHLLASFVHGPTPWWDVPWAALPIAWAAILAMSPTTGRDALLGALPDCAGDPHVLSRTSP